MGIALQSPGHPADGPQGEISWSFDICQFWQEGWLERLSCGSRWIQAQAWYVRGGIDIPVVVGRVKGFVRVDGS
jgi:hypothetical protein